MQPSGAASHLDLFEQPAAILLLKKAHLLRWRPRPHAQRGSLALARISGSLALPPAQLAKRRTPRVQLSGAASQLDLFEVLAGTIRE